MAEIQIGLNNFELIEILGLCFSNFTLSQHAFSNLSVRYVTIVENDIFTSIL